MFVQKKPKLASDVTVEELATLTENYTGADLAGLVRQASLHALKDSIAASLLVDASEDASSSSQTADHALCVSRDNFVKALAHIRPSVSEEVSKHPLWAAIYKNVTCTVFHFFAGQTTLRQITKKVYGHSVYTAVILSVYLL